MLPVTYKILASTIALGSLVGGGYGISKSLNTSSKVISNRVERTPKDIKGEKLKASQIYSSKKEEVSLLKVKKVVVSGPKITEKQPPFQENKKSDLDSPIKETEKEILLPPKITEAPKLIKVEDDISLKDNLEEEIDHEKLQEVRMNEEKQKSISEKYERNISLEAIWMFGIDGKGSTKRGISCVLLSNNQEVKEYPDMLESHDEIDDESDDYVCNSTSWYKWMEYTNENEDLWIRGKKDEINNLIENNGDNWRKGAHFLVENYEKLNSINSKFDKNLCQIKDNMHENNEDWLEIKCSLTEKPRQYFW